MNSVRALILALGLLFVHQAFAALELSSPDLSNSLVIPRQFTCHGGNLSPLLTWQGAPPATQSFVLIVSDPDAAHGLWYHWVVYNIPASQSQISRGIKIWPKGVGILPNSWGRLSYSGPCPPPGKLHRYRFTLYALQANGLSPKNIKELRAMMRGVILQSSSILVMYGTAS